MTTEPRKILSGKEVGRRTDRSRVQRWRDVKAGAFPSPVEIGPNRIGWFEDEVEAWLESRPRRTYGAPQPDGKPPDVLPDRHSCRPPDPHRVEDIEKRTKVHPVSSTSEARLLEPQDAQ